MNEETLTLAGTESQTLAAVRETRSQQYLWTCQTQTLWISCKINSKQPKIALHKLATYRSFENSMFAGMVPFNLLLNTSRYLRHRPAAPTKYTQAAIP